jgi:hypothetical protein
MYYGPATAAAVSKMQVMFRAEVLTPNGLVNPTGYFGASSRAKANGLCIADAVVTPTPDTDEDGMEDEDEDEDEEDFVLGGSADLDVFEVEDADDTNIEEGDNDVEIGVFNVEFQNGDAELSRMDIALVANSGNDEQDPWDTFETISLWVDGDMIAEMDADDEDDYLDEDNGSLRFSNLGLIAMEDEEVEITVGASVQTGMDDGSDGEEWNLFALSVRYFDADGVAITEDRRDDLGETSGTNAGAAAEFQIEEEGFGEELTFRLSSSNPDSTDIIVDENNSTNDVTIMSYDIEADEGDIELNRLVVRVDTPGASTTKIVNDIELVIDGQSFRDESITSGGLSSGRSQLVTSAGESVWYLFDIDGDIVIDEDEEVEVEVVVDFKRQDGNYNNGQRITAKVGQPERDETEAEGGDDLGTADFRGTAVGDTHTLVAEGIVLPVDGVETSTDTQGEGATTLGIFEIEFEVTAVEGTFYVTDNAALASTTPSDGLKYTVIGPSGAAVNTAVVSAVVSSTGDESVDDAFTVREGETETFTLKVDIDPSAGNAGNYRVRLDSVFYSTDTDGSSSVIEEYMATPATDFRTGFQTINN